MICPFDVRHRSRAVLQARVGTLNKVECLLEVASGRGGIREEHARTIKGIRLRLIDIRAIIMMPNQKAEVVLVKKMIYIVQ